MSTCRADLAESIEDAVSNWPAVAGYVAVRKSALSLADKSECVWASMWNNFTIYDTHRLSIAYVFEGWDTAVSIMNRFSRSVDSAKYVLCPVAQVSDSLGHACTSWAGMLQAEIDAWPRLRRRCEQEMQLFSQTEEYVAYDDAGIAEGDYLRVNISSADSPDIVREAPGLCHGGYCINAALRTVYLVHLRTRVVLRADTSVRRTGRHSAQFLLDNQSTADRAPFMDLCELRERFS